MFCVLRGDDSAWTVHMQPQRRPAVSPPPPPSGHLPSAASDSSARAAHMQPQGVQQASDSGTASQVPPKFTSHGGGLIANFEAWALCKPLAEARSRFVEQGGSRLPSCLQHGLKASQTSSPRLTNCVARSATQVSWTISDKGVLILVRCAVCVCLFS